MFEVHQSDQPASMLEAFSGPQTLANNGNRSSFTQVIGNWESLSIPFKWVDRSDWHFDFWAPGFFAEAKFNSAHILPSSLNLDTLYIVRKDLNEKLKSFSAFFDCAGMVKVFDDTEDEDWTFQMPAWGQIQSSDFIQLETFVVQQCQQFGSTVVSCLDYVYRAGELVYENFIDLVSWINDHFHSLVQQLRLVESLISEVFRSGKGAAAVTSMFVNERAWYLHHSAHPPEIAVKAVEGRFAAAVRRVRFRPQPA
jgi:hypothetical protein